MCVFVPTLRPYAIGVFIGAAMTFYLWVLETPPEWIAKWRRGAEGELKTAKALQRLEKDGWMLLHDVQHQRGNFDHIALGPPGLFLIDSKNLTGEVSLEGDRVVVRQSPDGLDQWQSTRIATAARSGALQLRDQLGVSRPPWVQSVVVFWGDFPAGEEMAERVVFLSGERLSAWLASRPPALSPARLQQLGEALRGLPPAASSAS